MLFQQFQLSSKLAATVLALGEIRIQNMVHTIALFTLLLPAHPGMVGDTVCGINSENTLSLPFEFSEGTEDGLIYSFISHCSHLLLLG